MSRPLEIIPTVAETVLEQALDEAPLECCGILLGDDPRRATQALPADNVHDNPRTEYEIDPEALFEAVERAEEADVELVGFYHSHPRGYAAFSKTDVARGSWEGKAYLLASLAPVALVGGVWGGEGFEELEVHVDIDA